MILNGDILNGNLLYDDIFSGYDSSDILFSSYLGVYNFLLVNGLFYFLAYGSGSIVDNGILV